MKVERNDEQQVKVKRVHNKYKNKIINKQKTKILQ